MNAACRPRRARRSRPRSRHPGSDRSRTPARPAHRRIAGATRNARPLSCGGPGHPAMMSAVGGVGPPMGTRSKAERFSMASIDDAERVAPPPPDAVHRVGRGSPLALWAAPLAGCSTRPVTGQLVADY